MDFKYTHLQLLEDDDAAKEAKAIEGCQFSGTVTIKSPDYSERLRLPKQIGIDKVRAHSKKIEEMTDDERADVAMEGLEYMAKAAEVVKRYVVDCDLTHKDGTKISTTDDLYSHPDASDLVSGVASLFLAGFVTKKKKPSSEPS